MTFNPQPKPGKDRVVNRKLLTALKGIIARCEWPEGCGCVGTDNLDAHHIFGRGIGGGKRDDRPDGVAILCSRHHNRGPGENAHDANWWNRAGRERIQAHVRATRSDMERDAIAALVRGKGNAF